VELIPRVVIDQSTMAAQTLSDIVISYHPPRFASGNEHDIPPQHGIVMTIRYLQLYELNLDTLHCCDINIEVQALSRWRTVAGDDVETVSLKGCAHGLRSPIPFPLFPSVCPHLSISFWGIGVDPLVLKFFDFFFHLFYT
jgi:hypothetical protein